MAVGIAAGTGISSGLNYSDIIKQLIELEKRPAYILLTRQNDYKIKSAALLSLSAKLSSYKSSLEQLNSASQFNVKTASVTKTSSGSELLTVSASSTAVAGMYDIQVNQLATANKLASQGILDTNSTAIASGSGNFQYRIGSSGSTTTLSINDSMTLEGLRDAINSAGATGVRASISNDGTGSNPYRLILTADNSGSANTIEITQNNTTLDFEDKQVEAAYANTSNTYTGTAGSSGTYTGTTNKTFLVEITTGGTPASTNARYQFSTDGGITWTTGVTVAADDTLQYVDGNGSSNSTNEGVQLKFTSGTLAIGDRFTIDVFNPEMQEAKDAVIEIDNSTIVKSSNTITDAIQGVTLNLLKADTSSTLTLSVSTSAASTKANIESLVESYNSLYKFINDQLSYDPDTDEEAEALLGDPTLLEIRKKIGDVVTGTIPGLSTASYTNLSQIGITTDYVTGELSLDTSKLSSALSSDPDAVAKLFIGTGTPSNTAITFVSKTTDTQAGTHSIYITTPPEQATLTGDNDLSSTGLGSAETLIFKFSENYTETNYSKKTFSVTLAQDTTINSIVNEVNSAFASNDAALAATATSDGKLKITSTDYGADIWFQVYTDVGDASSQIWDTDDTRSDAGVDIIGTINNHQADALGNVLTAKSGFSEEGLVISTTSNQTGGFGTVRVSLGIADRLPATLDSYTNSKTGIIKLKDKSFKETIDDIGDQIKRIEKRLVDKEKRLRAQFARLEVILAKYEAQSQYLTNQLSNLYKPTSK